MKTQSRRAGNEQHEKRNAGKRFINTLIRVSTLGIRFLLIIFLAKIFEPEVVGLFGLFVATVGFVLYFVGFDLYTHTTRELTKVDVGQQGRLLKSHFCFSIPLFIVSIPVCYIFTNGNWPQYLLLWFPLILLLEYVAQEMFRFLVVLGDQIYASILMFVRQGLWVLAFVAYAWWTDFGVSLNQVFLFWTVGGFVAVLIGAWRFYLIGIAGWRRPIDFSWIWKGVRVGSIFLLATVALRGLQTLDRFWVEALGGLEAVGAYVLFFSLAGALLLILDASVFAFSYPKLIRLCHVKAYDQANRLLRKCGMETLFITLAFSVATLLVVPILIDWLNRPAYEAYFYLFPWVLSASVLNALALIPHYALYARNIDKAVVASSLIPFFVFAIAFYFIKYTVDIEFVIILLNFSFLFILVYKSASLMITSAKENR